MRSLESILASVSVALLCLVWSATAHADPITFSASVDSTGIAQVVPNIARCGAAPPKCTGDRTAWHRDIQLWRVHVK
jgi:hypothetical protein